MTQPTPYTRAFNFTNQQSTTPADPVPGDQLDAEFNRIKQSLDETHANIALIQRDDGGLANDSVGADQLKASVVLAVDAPVAWTTATSYTTTSTVFESNILYRCLVAHTSGTFATDLAAGKWVELSDFNANLANYLPLAGGTMTGNIAMGSSKVTGLGAGSADGHSVRYNEFKHTIRTGAGGRLTLTSGAPLLTAAVSAATTVYYTPYRGDGIALYDGSAWQRITFSEKSLSVAALTADTNYDIFGYLSSGDLALEATAWTNSTTRATALTYLNGVLVKSGTTTRRYLGTVRINSTGGQIDWSPGGSGSGGVPGNLTIFNADNRERQIAVVRDSTSTWTYSTAAYRSTNNSTGNRVNVLIGLDGVPVRCHYAQRGQTAATANDLVGIGIGLNSTSSAGGTTALARTPAAGAMEVTLIANNNTNTLIGFNFLQALEIGNTNTVIFSGGVNMELALEVWQ